MVGLWVLQHESATSFAGGRQSSTMASWQYYVPYQLKCVYCGFDGKPQKAWWLFSNDHLVPQKLGGGNEDLNIVLACSGCNSTKKDFDPTDGSRDPLTPESRDRLIERARNFIRKQRAMWEQDAHWRRIRAELGI
jgi:hypothetical protein